MTTAPGKNQGRRERTKGLGSEKTETRKGHSIVVSLTRRIIDPSMLRSPPLAYYTITSSRQSTHYLTVQSHSQLVGDQRHDHSTFILTHACLLFIQAIRPCVHACSSRSGQKRHRHVLINAANKSARSLGDADGKGWKKKSHRVRVYLLSYKKKKGKSLPPTDAP